MVLASEYDTVCAFLNGGVKCQMCKNIFLLIILSEYAGMKLNLNIIMCADNLDRHSEVGNRPYRVYIDVQ